MNEPASDEPIATGWANTQLSGDIGLAQSYLREARRLVGQLRSIHGVNARIAAGEPAGFFRARRVLPDGTRIDVVSNGGNDRIWIDAPLRRAAAPPPPEPPSLAQDAVVTPPPPVPEAPGVQWDEPELPAPLPPLLLPEDSRAEEDDDIEYEVLAVAGASSSADASLPFVWNPDDGFTYIPLLADCYYGAATAISYDGDTACGTMGGDERDTAFVWSRADGTVDLGTAGMDGQLFAYGISADASIIVGQSWDNVNGYRACYWEARAGGFRIGYLPPIAAASDAAALAISGDGQYITGWAKQPNGHGAAPRRALRWRASADGYLIDTLLPERPPGGLQEAAMPYLVHVDHYDQFNVFTFSTDATYTLATSTAHGNIHLVASTGEVSDQVQDLYHEPLYPFAVIGTETSGPSTSDGGHTYTTVTNKLLRWYIPHELTARSISADGAVIVGDSSDGYAFRWTEQAGLELLVAPVSEFSPSMAYGVSADASTIVGRRGSNWFCWTAPRGALDSGPGVALAVAQGGDLAVGNDSAATFTPGVQGVMRSAPVADGNYVETALGFGAGGLYSSANAITHITVILHPDGSIDYDPELPIFF